MSKQKFYVVWKGRRPGIYTSWEDCRVQVTGFPGAEYKAFPSREMAEAAWRGTYADYQGRNVSARQWLFAPQPPETPSLCVDAACAASPGPVEYQGVRLPEGEQVFHQGPFAEGTNNVGEFLAIVHALAWLDMRDLDWVLYSDSRIAIGWARRGECRTRLQRTEANRPLFELIRRAEEWLRGHPAAAGRVRKWDTEAWGEIPADFGRK